MHRYYYCIRKILYKQLKVFTQQQFHQAQLLRTYMYLNLHYRDIKFGGIDFCQ